MMDSKWSTPSTEEKGKQKKGHHIRLVLFLSVLLAGAGFLCLRSRTDFFSGSSLTVLQHPGVHSSQSGEQVQADFDEFVHQIFVSEVSEDSLTLHFSLKNPADYGVEDIQPTLGTYSMPDFQNSMMVSENWMVTLKKFDYQKLTREQQLIYDALDQILQTNLKASDMLEYSECLGPTTGIQAQLPILLAEYTFYSEEDVKDYLELLRQVPDYFSQILEFEQMKSDRGLFMGDRTLESILTQCEEFIAEPEENFLLKVFSNKVNSLEEISDSDRKAYCQENETAVLESVIPAYQTLMEGLEALKGKGSHDGGLCQLEKGKEYYAYLMEAVTGSQRSVREIDRLLDQTLTASQKKMSQIMTDSPDAYYDSQKIEYPYTDPVKTIHWLQQQIGGDFTVLPEDIHCSVKYVDESLEDSLSPAFYLTAPMDDYKENVVYINQSDDYDLSQAFTTVAHESYPGHLYQNAFFQQTDPAPIRSMISTGGYVEGWGTYAELYSYQLAGLAPEVAQLLQENTVATLCLYAKADIGVNYLGWDQKKLIRYLKDFGFGADQAMIVYDSMVAEPVSYLQYTLGYLEIQELLETAQTKLGGKFSLREFHDFFLSIGPVPFVVIEDRLRQWIEEGQKPSLN